MLYDINFIPRGKIKLFDTDLGELSEDRKATLPKGYKRSFSSF